MNIVVNFFCFFFFIDVYFFFFIRQNKFCYLKFKVGIVYDKSMSHFI